MERTYVEFFVRSQGEVIGAVYDRIDNQVWIYLKDFAKACRAQTTNMSNIITYNGGESPEFKRFNLKFSGGQSAWHFSPALLVRGVRLTSSGKHDAHNLYELVRQELKEFFTGGYNFRRKVVEDGRILKLNGAKAYADGWMKVKGKNREEAQKKDGKPSFEPLENPPQEPETAPEAPEVLEAVDEQLAESFPSTLDEALVTILAGIEELKVKLFEIDVRIFNMETDAEEYRMYRALKKKYEPTEG